MLQGAGYHDPVSRRRLPRRRAPIPSPGGASPPDVRVATRPGRRPPPPVREREGSDLPGVAHPHWRRETTDGRRARTPPHARVPGCRRAAPAHAQRSNRRGPPAGPARLPERPPVLEPRRTRQRSWGVGHVCLTAHGVLQGAWAWTGRAWRASACGARPRRGRQWPSRGVHPGSVPYRRGRAQARAGRGTGKGARRVAVRPGVRRGRPGRRPPWSAREAAPLTAPACRWFPCPLTSFQTCALSWPVEHGPCLVGAVCRRRSTPLLRT